MAGPDQFLNASGFKSSQNHPDAQFTPHPFPSSPPPQWSRCACHSSHSDEEVRGVILQGVPGQEQCHIWFFPGQCHFTGWGSADYCIKLEPLESVLLAILTLPGDSGKRPKSVWEKLKKVRLDLGMVLVRAGLKESQMAFRVYGCFIELSAHSTWSCCLGGSPGLGRGHHLSLEAHHTSMTSLSSSSLLESLNSTRVCFLIPSKLLFRRDLKGASETSEGCPWSEGAVTLLGVINPSVWHVLLSPPKAADCMATPPCPYWPQEGKSAWGPTSSCCELVELGPDGGISKWVSPGDILPGEGLPGRSACAMLSGMARLSGELCARASSA